MTTLLYNGEVKVLFNNTARNRYVVTVADESHSPVGVTTVLNKVLAKEALMFWPLNLAIDYLKKVDITNILTMPDWHELLEVASKLHTVRSDKGKDVGTLVHDMVENYLVNQLDGTIPEPLGTDVKEALAAYKAFTNWFESHDIEILGVEDVVYSREYDYAGKFDCLLKIDGKVVLCDVKTSNASFTSPTGIYPEYFLQLGAYANAFWEANDDPQIDDLMVINCNKQGKLSTLRASEIGLSVRDCEDAWLSVLSTYRFLSPLAKLIKEKGEQSGHQIKSRRVR